MQCSGYSQLSKRNFKPNISKIIIWMSKILLDSHSGLIVPAK